ncbi:porphobilinogen deaminase, putative [Eimeria maxima]|uniref:hydroxymethylbilane synthase n=1 Tax=Eimeria maxima TaxID=5804 RepID=U6MA30_EIMMA|nr:porphobilinogen deaminase, putative [Eimeria maxima]CDJ60901.1 porphobilinogen deaminase, putative [Eimeria maxima]
MQLLLLLLLLLLLQLSACSGKHLCGRTLGFAGVPLIGSSSSSRCRSNTSNSSCYCRNCDRSSNRYLPKPVGSQSHPTSPTAVAAAASADAAPAAAVAAAAEREKPLLRVGSRWSPLALAQAKEVLRLVVFAAADRFPAAVAAFLEEDEQQQQLQQQQQEELLLRREKLGEQCSELLKGTAAGELPAAAAAALQQRLRYGEVELVPHQTAADKQLQQQLLQLGGKGLFSKELDDALQQQQIHFAVHSLKDVNVLLPSSMTLAALLPREDPRDVLLFAAKQQQTIQPLLETITAAAGAANAAAAAAAAAANADAGGNSITVTETNFSSSSNNNSSGNNSSSCSSSSRDEILIGTSSLRRQALMLYLAGSSHATAAAAAGPAKEAAAAAARVRCVLLRGNVQTRLRKLREGVAHATLLAAAGLRRLSLLQQHPTSAAAAGLEILRLAAPYGDTVAVPLPEVCCTPAAAQGIIAAQCLSQDTSTLQLLLPINDSAAATAAAAERAFLQKLDGSCKTPLGAIAMLRNHQQQQQQQQNLEFKGFVGTPDGCRMFHVAAAAAVRTPQEAAEVGAAAANKIKAAAGSKFLSDIISQVQQGWGSLKP